MKFKQRLVYPLAVMVMSFMVQSCGPAEPGVYKNGEIKSGKRDDFHRMNDQLFEACKANKPKEVENLMSKEMLQAGGYVRNIDMISGQSKPGGYDLLDEYYIVNYKPREVHTIKTKALDGTPYTLNCSAAAEEMYLAFLVPKTKGDKYMITAMYHKLDYGWRLTTLDFQPYTVMGKTAPQLYRSAKEQLGKGYLTDAINTMQLVDRVLNLNFYWQYPEKADMVINEGKMVELFNNTYTFPLTLSQVSTKPKIFNIERLTLDEGVFPDVYYLSAINLKDTTALRNENVEVKNVIGKLFPGIDKGKKYICFSIFNEKPTGKKTVPSYDMTVKL